MRRITILVLAVAFLSGSLFSQIIVAVNGTRQIDEERQVVFFTATYNSVNYEWHGNTPVLTGVELTNWLTARRGKLVVGILWKIYPDADFMRFKTDANTRFTAVKEWIQAGHKNLVDEDEQGDPIYEVIVKQEFKSTHPPWIKWEAQIDAVTTIEELKLILKKIIKKIQ